LSLLSILILQLFYVNSSSSVNINEFKNLKNLWWLFSNKVNDSHWVEFLITAHDLMSCHAQDWLAWCCFSLRINIFSHSWVLISFRMSIDAWLIFSWFNLLLCSICMKIQCSMHFRIKFHWALSSFNILITSLSWLSTHWCNWFLFFMFYEISTFSTSFKTSIDSMKTHLFAMLLSNQADHDSTNLKLCVMIYVYVMINVNSKKLLWIFW